ncbi:DUF5700 domain-containing putative Zn-dependent protease [Sporosalibacterium faouarense]|uniref:DUF5700 domain-containing putative Zn-dependent protease n=1 Tax=Sporosalibacterium faouarense TaxID=516123 RepID=UPI00192B693A|nr:DUF5700 domain-containing putative Zn-dependent protease [Sporosalibacterium faouarense]
MGVKITLSTEGFDCFYDVFNTKKVLKKQDIEILFNTFSYEKMIKLFGKNVGLTKREHWVNLFYEAYCRHLKLIESNIEKDPIKENIIDSVLWALNNFESLYANVERIKEIINEKDFISKALKYLPVLDSDIEIDMELYIFMNNACVEKGQVLLDVSFLSQLNEEQVNDLLAHELHHYMKSHIRGIYKQTKEGHEDVVKSLFALENEGIADMCSFKGLSFIYEFLGFMEKVLMEDVLNNPVSYMKKFGEMLKNKLEFQKESINLYDFLMRNQIIHPLGYSMGRNIEDVFGLDELKSCVGNPFKFLLKYHHSIEIKNGEKILDGKTIEYLDNIYSDSI